MFTLQSKSLKSLKSLYRKLFSYYRSIFVSPLSYPNVYQEFGLSKLISCYLNSIRLNFWTFIAKYHEPFSALYDENEPLPSLCSSSLSLSSIACDSLDSLAEKALLYGVSFLPNFLVPDDYARVCLEFENLSNSKIQPTTFGESVMCFNSGASFDIKNIFSHSISVLTHRTLGKSIDISAIGMQYLYLGRNLEDRGDPNTLLHIDRFLPCIKIFYFPYCVRQDSSPFGYIPLSHRVTKSYLNSVRNAFISRKHNQSSKFPFQVSNTSLFSEILLEVPNNTLVLAFTNGIHRRVPFSLKDNDSEGMRSSLRFIFYNQFTSYDLIMT